MGIHPCIDAAVQLRGRVRWLWLHIDASRHALLQVPHGKLAPSMCRVAILERGH